MVRHQAIRPDVNLMGTAELRDQFQVGLVILLAEERLLATVFSLRDDVRQARYDNSRQSCHEPDCSGSGPALVNNYVGCPRNTGSRIPEAAQDALRAASVEGKR
jgi:hypothetical protein